MLPNDNIREGIFQATPVFLRNQGKYLHSGLYYTYDSHSSIHCMYLLHNGLILYLNSIFKKSVQYKTVLLILLDKKPATSSKTFTNLLLPSFSVKVEVLREGYKMFVKSPPYICPM